MRWTEAQLVAHLARRRPNGDPGTTAKRHARRAARPMRIEPDESAIQCAIVDHLRLRGRAGMSWFHVPNGELRDAGTAAKLKRMGTRPGVPDLLLLIDGRLHGLELKRARGGTVSEAQRVMHEEMRGAGAVVETARGLEHALDVLAAWGALVPSNGKGKQ